MGLFNAIGQRMPAISCAFLATASLALSIGTFTTCQFLKISHSAHTPEDGFLVSDSNIEEHEDYDYDRHNVGIFCPSVTYSRNDDLMWKLSRYFLIGSFGLLGLSVFVSWGIATFVQPTYRNWKCLSVVSILTAGLQIPVFLFYTIKPCQNTERSCSAGAGFFMLLWSVLFLTTLTVVTQCFNYPEWREDMERWKVQDRDNPLFDHHNTFDLEEDPDQYNLDTIDAKIEEREMERRMKWKQILQDEDDADASDGSDGMSPSPSPSPYPTQELNVNGRRNNSRHEAGEDTNRHGDSNSYTYPIQYPYPTQELNVKRLKARREDGDNDSITGKSQCLSGMGSGLLFSYDDEHEEEQQQDNLSSIRENLAHPLSRGKHKDNSDSDVYHNENWGENLRNKDNNLEDDQEMPEEEIKLNRSPKRWSSFLNNKSEDVGYIFLTEEGEDDEQIGINMGDTSSLSKTEKNINANVTTICVTPPIPEDAAESNRDDGDACISEDEKGYITHTHTHTIEPHIQHDHIVIKEATNSLSHSDDVSNDSHDSDYFDCEVQPQNLPLPPNTNTNTKDVPLVPAYTEPIGIAESSNANIVSDDENDNDSRADIYDARARTRTRSNGRSAIPSDMQVDKLLSQFTEKEDDTDEIDYQPLEDDENSSCEQSGDNKWHDVLDNMNIYPHIITHQDDSHDFDDGRDHYEMMKTLRRSNSRVESLEKKKYVKTESRSRDSITRMDSNHYTSDDSDERHNHVILSEEGGKRHVYDDEVEV